MDPKKQKGVRQRIERGEWVGRTPYGYTRTEDGNLKINEDEAKVVVEIFELFYISGWNYHEIARELNKRLIGKKGAKQWRPNTILRIVNSITYYGRIRFKGQIYYGIHQPILTKEYAWPGDYAIERKRQKEILNV